MEGEEGSEWRERRDNEWRGRRDSEWRERRDSEWMGRRDSDTKGGVCCRCIVKEVSTCQLVVKL